MTDPQQQPNDPHAQPEPNEAFRDALRSFAGRGIDGGIDGGIREFRGVGDFEIPQRVDDAVLEAARATLTPTRRSQTEHWPRHWRRWAASLAAAVITLSFWFSGLFSAGNRTAPTSSTAITSAVRGDIDLSGRVDILDAFMLARHVEAADDQPGVTTVADMNGDGALDHVDVDFIANRAVALPPQEAG